MKRKISEDELIETLEELDEIFQKLRKEYRSTEFTQIARLITKAKNKLIKFYSPVGEPRVYRADV